MRNVFPGNQGYNLNIKSKSSNQTILDSRRDSVKIDSIQSEYQQNVESEKSHKQLNVIAEIEAIDKIQGKFRAKTFDGELFEGSITDLDSLDISFLPNRIEIDGVFTLDDAGLIETADYIGKASEVEIEEITVSEFEANDQPLVADPPLTFQISRIAADCYLVEGELGILLHAETRKDVKELLSFDLEDLWLEYALEEDSKLAEDARNLKKELLDRIRYK